MVKKLSISIFSGIIFASFFFWLACVPINIKSGEFWTLFIFTLAVIFGVYVLMSFFNKGFNGAEGGRAFIRAGKPFLIIIAIFLVIILIGAISGAAIFNSKRYYNQLKMTEGDFAEDIKEISFSQIPVVDRDTAQRLGNRQLGSVAELVSQFNVSDIFSLINYKNVPTRVSPLEYADFFKWIGNHREGIPYYVIVNLATQDSDLVKLDKPMKYGMSDLFNRNVIRHARLKFPTKMFDEVNFELDEEGNPFWVISVIDHKIGLFSGKDAVGVILVNAVDGEAKYYKISEIPQWIDRAFGSSIIMTQINNNGKYKNGYWNSKFGQRDVLQSTEGYNYLSINDDIWLYTGLTSVVKDESNIGFTLVNLRTKEAKFYPVYGAEEFSAMSSAEGKVQEKRYTATFPLLINIEDHPTYFLSLKDGAGLVKMYAFISVEDYQTVGVAETIPEARGNYIKQLSGNGIINGGEIKNISGLVSSVITSVKNGNTQYYIQLYGSDTVYIASIEISDLLPLIKAGDNVKISYKETTGKIAYATNIDFD